jgi:hypothetical protein
VLIAYMCFYGELTSRKLTHYMRLHSSAPPRHPHGILQRGNCPSAKGKIRHSSSPLKETVDERASSHNFPKRVARYQTPPSLIGKTLSVTGVARHSGPTTRNLSAFFSPIPWRNANLRCNSNDIYFDIVETLDAVVNK